jgi:hypothetical protein
LGYYFADDAIVLRILSYTNYHPGLIQLFCQELLKRLHARTGSALPPYRIEQNDVEAVYRIPEVQERIRERFEWTLALDTRYRYQAIAWALIADQMDTRDSYAQAYPAGDILRLVGGVWPQGFSDVSIDQLRGLLDEMCGLGVLVRNADGHYRLRSPNLVRLLGTEIDIANRLEELAKQQPPASPFDANDYHAPLDDSAEHYSPLTYAQERNLSQQQWGVGLVFASEALGLSAVPKAFERFLPMQLPEGVGGYAEIPAEMTTGEQLNAWLVHHLQTYAGYERLIIYQRLTGCKQEDMASLVDAAWHFCRHHQVPQRWMRVLFLFDPPGTWRWLSLPQTRREELENRADALAFPHRWNLVGIRQRLAQHNKMHSDEVCQQVRRATGGWPILLNTLFDRCGRHDDPRPFAQAIESELTDRGVALRRQFSSCVGLEGNEIARHVLEFILREEPVPLELLTPELIGGELPVTPEDCLSAIEYLQRMGSLAFQDDTVSVEPVLGSILQQP